jgi:hypothetical protein
MKHHMIDLPDDVLSIIWDFVRMDLHRGWKPVIFKAIHNELISNTLFDEEDVDLVVFQTGLSRMYVQHTLYWVHGDIIDAIKSIYDDCDLWYRFNPLYPNAFVTVRFAPSDLDLSENTI